MSSVVIAVLAFIGACSVVAFVVWPLAWCICYATGRLIFLVRTAEPELVRRNGVRRMIRATATEWRRGFGEAITCPATCITIGPMKWRPLFKYSGFKRRKP